LHDKQSIYAARLFLVAHSLLAHRMALRDSPQVVVHQFRQSKKMPPKRLRVGACNSEFAAVLLLSKR
jgi:hypothetical protein